LIGMALIGATAVTFGACGGGIGGNTSFFNSHPFASANSAAGTRPVAVAIDRSGNIWAANEGSNSVTELKSSGKSTFDNSNTPGANFNLPDAIAIDADGDIWVVNGGGSATELTSHGALIGNFAPAGANFSNPVGVAIDASGNVWITNMTGNSVTELDSAGALLRNINNTNTPAAAFGGPAGIAIDGAGNVWVGNFSGNSLTKLNSSGAAVANFNNANTSRAKFSGCAGVAIDEMGDVWIVNSSGNSVTELASSGALIGNFAPPKAKFNGPFGIAIDQHGSVFITNGSDASITELRPTGAARRVFSSSNTLGDPIDRPVDIAIARDGSLWTANQGVAPGHGFIDQLFGGKAPHFSGPAAGPQFFPFGGLNSSSGPQWPAGL
jgi:streptogramin lyase